MSLDSSGKMKTVVSVGLTKDRYNSPQPSSKDQGRRDGNPEILMVDEVTCKPNPCLYVVRTTERAHLDGKMTFT